MKSSTRSTAVRKLLDLCDDLHRIRNRLSDPELHREARTRLRRQSKRKSDQLTRNLAEYRFKGPLGQIMREYSFGPKDFEILAVMLHRAMRSDEGQTEGRVLLASVFETSFEVLSGMESFQDTAPLRASGLVVTEDEEEAHDVLETRFRLSDEAIEAFRHEVGGAVPEDLRRRKIDGYCHNRELLVDLRILHNLYKHRSERAFHADRWDRLHHPLGASQASATKRIDTFWRRIRQRLSKTSEPTVTLPALRFMQRHGLLEAEMVVVVHLLFKELYEGNAYADAAELVKLVSRDEDDLIRNRRLMLQDSTLLGDEILLLEPVLEGRELTGEVYLSDSAVNEMFGVASGAVERTIATDERLEWHLYLKGLEDTQTFYRDLDS